MSTKQSVTTQTEPFIIGGRLPRNRTARANGDGTAIRGALLIGILLAAQLGLAVPARAQSNLLDNPGFENGVNGWSFPLGAEPSASGDAYDGSYLLDHEGYIEHPDDPVAIQHVALPWGYYDLSFSAHYRFKANRDEPYVGSFWGHVTLTLAVDGTEVASVQYDDGPSVSDPGGDSGWLLGKVEWSGVVTAQVTVTVEYNGGFWYLPTPYEYADIWGLTMVDACSLTADRVDHLESICSTMPHGSVSYAHELLGPEQDPPIECRVGAPVELAITFKEALQAPDGLDPADIALSAGTVVGATFASPSELVLTLTDMPSAGRVSIGFPGLTDANGNPFWETGCIAILTGDANQSGAVDIFDLLAIRNLLGTTIYTPTSLCLKDVEASGTIDIYDLLAIRNTLTATLPSSCP